ncbi:MAG: CxxC-x17-CxxC domain-containing protein [Patescibacteria group bacterium]
MQTITFFAKTNFRNQERNFGIKRDDRRRHVYVIGKTGMGKTNLLENMAIQDIRSGAGVCFIDPHGESAEKMLKAVPNHRINDVIYFNPADSEYPIAFNILEAVDESKKNLVASGMMGVFKKLWPDVWSARMEYILNNTILALLDYPGSTMLGVNRMMSDKDYRKRVYPLIKDPVVKSFWINEFDKWEDRFRKEAVAAIQNKVGQFLSSSLIRHIVGQPKSTIDMRDIMDNQKILIVNLSKGRIGEDAMRLLGGMIVTKIQLAAMGRVDMPEEKRKDFYLHVDEFQNFVTESFANILSEARKYHLNLTLAHQYINQLVFDNNTTVRDAVFGNVGTLVAFRVGAEDAEFLEKEFEPVFLINDLVNLTKFHIYLKLMIDGIAGDAFSATTLPPPDLSDTEENGEKIIRISRERYGQSRAEIEEKIERWSGMFISKPVSVETKSAVPEDNVEKTPYDQPAPQRIIQAKNQAKSKAAEAGSKSVPDAEVFQSPAVAVKREEKYEAICATCEQPITVPFKPDPKRPAFCKECLKDYQRAMARTRNEALQNKNTKDAPKNIIRDNEFKKINREKRYSEVVAYVPREKTMSLNQMSHIAPKKFKTQRKKPQVNLDEVRRLIKENKERTD